MKMVQMQRRKAVNDAHKQRYQHALQEYRFARGMACDRQWEAMLLLLTALPAFWAKLRPYIDLKHGSAYLEQAVKEVDLTGGERRILALAHNLFNSGAMVDMADIADTLDDDNWTAVLEALAVYRGGQ